MQRSHSVDFESNGAATLVDSPLLAEREQGYVFVLDQQWIIWNEQRHIKMNIPTRKGKELMQMHSVR